MQFIGRSSFDDAFAVQVEVPEAQDRFASHVP
jgi:hypothetical protein